nr:AAA family ATPase [Burkholderia sp. Ac-20353]
MLSARGELRSLRVVNFRAIDNVEIPFSKVRSTKAGTPCLLILGENAVGKSTCLSAIALALLGTKQAKKLRLPYYELARSADRRTWNLWGKERLEVTIWFHDAQNGAEFYYDPVRKSLDGTAEQSTVVLGYGPHRYFANAQGRRGATAAEKVRSLFDPRRPLPDPTDWLKGLSGRKFDEVARTIRTILPTGDDDQLVNDRQAGICVLAQGQLTPVNQLSEGYRSVFAMVADICRSLFDHWSNLETAQGVVLIDEIETHLHPRWKMRVMSSLRQAFPAVQFVATTHDPLCVRGMDDGEVIVLTRNEDGGVQVLEDLPRISGMSAEQILTSEYFGLSSTIDPEVHLEIARLAQSVEAKSTQNIGYEAKALISKLTVGDSAAAQVIHDALLRYLSERELPVDSLSPSARSDAVAAVFRALRSARGGQ